MFGEWLRQQRDALGLSQPDIARAVGITQQGVSKWEKDNTTPGLIQADSLARVLNVSIDEIVRQIRESMLAGVPADELQADNPVEVMAAEVASLRSEVEKLRSERAKLRTQLRRTRDK